MDTGTGHIWDLEKQEVRDIKGKLVEWKIGEKIEIKGCLFEVAEIKCNPEDKIVLRGLAKELKEIDRLKELLPEKTFDEQSPREMMRDFLQNKKK